MPNPYLIYLHDTPAKHLFNRGTRAFSSGCIRLEQPAEFARFLIDRQAAIEQGRLDDALAGTRTRYIGMTDPVPIVVLYATIDLDDAGDLVFGPDIYGKDRESLFVLNQPARLEPEKILLAGNPIAARAADDIDTKDEVEDPGRPVSAN